MADVDLGPHRRENRHRPRPLEVGTRDVEAALQENLRYRGHPGPPDADEVNLRDIREAHEICLTSSATRNAASGRARVRAACDIRSRTPGSRRDSTTLPSLSAVASAS